MAPWHVNVHGRNMQAVSKGTGFVLFSLLLLYCLYWSLLPSIPAGSSAHTASIPILEAESPHSPPSSCPPPVCPAPPTPPSPYDPKKVAFLVETRPLPHLPALFSHMVSIVPPEWTFKFMGSPDSISHMRSSPRIRNIERDKKLQIVPIPAHYSVSDRESISQMFTDPHLYSRILSPAEHLLIFQPDGIFCANSPKTLNDFLDWDWIGAPWSDTAQWGGNGGLSLRKVSKVLKVLEKEHRTPGHGELEDLWLSNRINGLEGAKMPGANISKGFSVESVWDEQPLGYHVGWLGVHHGQIWDDQGQVDHILEYCPEVKMILGMRLEGDKPKGVEG